MELKGTIGNSFEPLKLKVTLGNTYELIETQGISWELTWTHKTQGNSRNLRLFKGSARKRWKREKDSEKGEKDSEKGEKDSEKRVGQKKGGRWTEKRPKMLKI